MVVFMHLWRGLIVLPFSWWRCFELGATSHTSLRARDHRILRSLIGQKADIVEVHLTLEGECLSGQRSHRGWTHKLSTWQTMDNVSWFARICTTHWWRCGQTMSIKHVIRPLDKSHGPPQIYGHGLGLCVKWPWLTYWQVGECLQRLYCIQVYLSSIQHKHLTACRFLANHLKWPRMNQFKVCRVDFSVQSPQQSNLQVANCFRISLLDEWDVRLYEQ